ncbi:MAG: putative toxin-antitoxin system toxin component, PIN family [candidate division NC10 bacterium RIFCSPLOWO2_12_FULL_66_18]|nr:MAG: putative toxin-antitoxin system toxin component, PIN family [candidate division NC10 bacterium RIFCSPLOWO2_02_FULL_66_22]OGC01913.1 MAG: putative toxin-antitoxin system toxin component, PIN family [candidate division NC10 bacterium RIFCSPLOWO2_12_FULL_66_18]
MAKERVILDVNVWISGLLWTGTPNRLIQAAEDGDLTLVTTPAIVEEIRGAFARPKFAARITALNTSMGELMESLLSIVEVIQDPRIEAVISQDPDDDKILACAVAAGAGSIVSGDHHLLALKRYSGIPIVTPKQFWDAWAKRPE